MISFHYFSKYILLFIIIYFYTYDVVNARYRRRLANQIRGNSSIFENGTDRVYNELNNVMRKKVRIFCVILAGYNHKNERILPQLRTWVKRCDGHIYATGVNDREIHAIKAFKNDGYEYSYAKIRNGLKYVYKNFQGQYDFILKSDSDAYIIMENLRMHLYNRNPDEHLYAGYQMYTHTPKIQPKFALNQGGVGYVLSRKTVKDLVEIGFKNKKYCLKKNDGFEDVEIARCLKNMNIFPHDARDYRNRQLFFPTDPIYTAGIRKLSKKNPYYKAWSVHKFVDTIPMSQFPIGFHWVTDGMMDALEYLLYDVNVAGLENKFFALDDKNDEVYKEKVKYGNRALQIYSERYFK
uniref:N-acetylgalactosaminide beta-1,3-galactosyltransferase n=1 Tax=Parastrongyloides trichosuri TaxID=131310 RepID=A0A0N4Z5D4_PARTI